ncbi:MAG: alpha/beta fold hydrolase [Pseudomonadota bacterium]|nr:alpha/beta fold hydrolase [Pseudomonadota bacterium]
MSTRFGPLDGVVHGPADAPVTAVLLHGIGLGTWLWEPWLPHFAAAGVRTVALGMPGHDADPAPVGFADVVAGVEAALDAIGGTPVLVGHSMGGLVAQVLATRRRFAGVALVCPLPAGQVRVTPPRRGLRGGLSLVRPFLSGAPLRVGWDLYRSVGMDLIDEATARTLHARVVPWPNRLCRDLLFARPVVDPAKVDVPVLVALGARDALVSWQQARLLGDLYEAVTWRYDDLGHMPPWEPGGERLGRDLAAWVAQPSRPQVLESEGYGPAEGVGHELRRQRRGEEMKRRSAYGQKRSARGP